MANEKGQQSILHYLNKREKESGWGPRRIVKGDARLTSRPCQLLTNYVFLTKHVGSKSMIKSFV